MSPAADVDVAARPLLGPLLAAVSRSFYLSLRFLPPPVRETLGVSYLLARAADTIADVESRPAVERLSLLRHLKTVLAGSPGNSLLAELREFASGVPHAGEQELLNRMDECLHVFYQLPTLARRRVEILLGHILRGMELDLERFPESEPMRCLATRAELEEYTWLVAGCVGEFWTWICADQLPGVYTRDPGEMAILGKEYGQGLQLINILRDQAADAAIGRCYLPEESLRKAGLHGPVQWPAEDWAPWHAVRTGLLAEAHRHLQSGWKYAASLRSLRLRFAALMPLLIGAATLAGISRLPAGGAPAAFRIPRSEVRRLIRRALWMSMTNRIPIPHVP